MRHAPWPSLLLLVLVPCFPPRALGGVERVELGAALPVLDGREFGDVGAYEKLAGTIHFAYDPADPANRDIVDLAFAPTDADGLVRTWADLMVLAPVDSERGRGTALLEVSNRGGKAALGYFDRAHFAADPSSEGEFGDGLLLRRGLTLIWVGWQFDVPAEPGRMRLHVPRATLHEGGLVRADWTVDEPASVLELSHRHHLPYPVDDPTSPGNRLTVRDGPDLPRREVPRDEWSFAVEDADGRPVPDRTHIRMAAGFEPGRIYELVYGARDPAVVGLGLAAIRDTLSYAKHDPHCLFAVQRGLGLGISQTGRFLRHFIYQGFNTDEQGRQVFDGLLVHSAGAGRGSFNHRFAQPSRDGHRDSAFFYPTDLFPFSGRVQRDPQSGVSDGLFARVLADGTAPKLMFTNTGYDYWGRAASLVHTSLDGSADVAELPFERRYHLRGGQHFVDLFPPSETRRVPGARAFVGNPLNFLLTERALLLALQDWVESDVPPPPSAVPRIDQRQLVPPAELAFPTVPGLPPPRVVHQAWHADYGPRWSQGIIDHQPPLLGAPFPSLVCQVDETGNEIAGLPNLETLVPVASFTPWSLRTGLPGPQDELRDFRGCIAPLPRTDGEAAATGDARPSLASLYAGRDDYLERAAAAARELVARRLLLEEDVSAALTRAAALWDWAQTVH